MATTSSKYKFYSALAALIVWGGWAYYINTVGGKGHGLVSGITQGIASFIITYIVVLAVTRIYNAISHRALQIVTPAIVTVGCISMVLVAVHTAVGTPHILYTIAPTLSVAFLFCIVTALNLRRDEHTERT